MKRELEEKLYNDFPVLYAGKDLPETENLMSFGFECSDGWFNLIYELSEKITKLDPNVQAFQVKEKFGGLRFYVGVTNNETLDLIEEYEEASYRTCEKCGSMDNVAQTTGWVTSLCKTCMDEHLNVKISKSMEKRIKCQKGE